MLIWKWFRNVNIDYWPVSAGRGAPIHTIDLIILLLFLGGFTGFGLWRSRFNRTSKDYFLGKGKIPWPVALFSIVATETSVLTFISLPGIAYCGNWNFLQLAIGYIFGRVLVSIFLLPQYFKSEVTSIYEVLGKRFGDKVQKTASGLFLVTRTLADGVRFLSTAVIVQVVTGWSLPVAVLIIGVVTLLYTILGGIKTIIWVDSFQFVIYLVGAVLSISFLLNQIDQPTNEILHTLFASEKLEIFNLGSEIFTNVYHVVSAVVGGAIYSLASHGADYMMVQRVLACRDLKSAQKAMIGSGFFVLLQFAAFLFAGSLIFVFFNGAEITTDRVFSTYIVNHLPVGVKGLILAGVLSAAMSTLSSSINSLASSTIMDWMKKKSSLKLSQIVSLFWAVILMSIALLLDESDKALVEIGLEIASYTYGGLLGLFILSLTKKSFTPASLITGLIGGLSVAFLLKHHQIAWTWYVAFGASSNVIIAYCTENLFKFRKTDES